MMAKLLAGMVDIDCLLQWCIEFDDLDTKEKMALIDCIEKYLFHEKNCSSDVDSLLLSIVLQCSSGDYEEIRSTAVKCLAYIVKIHKNDIVAVALNKAVYDPSAHVRSTLINVCKNDIIPKQESKEFLRLLKHDANYIVRKRAREINH